MCVGGTYDPAKDGCCETCSSKTVGGSVILRKMLHTVRYVLRTFIDSTNKLNNKVRKHRLPGAAL